MYKKQQAYYNTGLSAPLWDIIKNNIKTKGNELIKTIKAPEVKTKVEVESGTLDAVKTVGLILGGSAILTALIIASKK